MIEGFCQSQQLIAIVDSLTFILFDTRRSFGAYSWIGATAVAPEWNA